MKEYLSCAETAKLVRGALKKAFPGIKFSVRSDVYSGGASIRVRYMDGPVTDAVKAVTNAYAGGGFDGSIDMAYYKESWLMPDGSAAFGSSSGTSGSMGYCEPYSYEAPAPGARKVQFGANFIFVDRDYSVPIYTAAVAKIAAEFGIEAPEVVTNSFGPYLKDRCPVYGANSKDLSELVSRALQEMPA
jgi:hypothetical protein